MGWVGEKQQTCCPEGREEEAKSLAREGGREVPDDSQAGQGRAGRAGQGRAGVLSILCFTFSFCWRVWRR